MYHNSDEPTSLERPTARLLAFLLALILASEGIALVREKVPLTDPDEALFANVARAMRERGDVLIPTDRGKAFLDRPAPFYHLLNLSVAAFGDRDFAYRAVSLLLGWFAAWIVYRWAKEEWGLIAGLTSALVLTTTPSAAVLGFAVGHDSALLASVAAASFWLTRIGIETRPVALIAGGAFMGLGLLAKGLLGVVLPTFALMSQWIAHRRWPTPRIAFSYFIALAIAVPFYIAAEWAHPGYLHYFFVERHALGFLTDSQRHGERGLWIYLLTAALGLLPWSIMLLFPRLKRAGERAHWMWLLGMFAFFCLAGSKNPTYLAPCLIPFSILAGGRLERWLNRSTFTRRQILLSRGALILIVVIWATSLFLLSEVVLPRAIEERTARDVVVALGDSQKRVLWFNHLPSSALYYGKGLRQERVYYRDLTKPLEEDVYVVCRRTRLKEINPLAAMIEAREIGVYGRFHVFECGPSTAKKR